MDSRRGRAAGALWPLAGVAAGIVACSILFDGPWRTGVTAALLLLAGALLWRFARRQSGLIARLRESATIDPLTGLLNRSGYEAQMEIELARASRDEIDLAFVIADVDDFKLLNDRLGHLGGDMALERVAAEIRRVGRGGDVAARLGGDEFAVILPGSDELGAVSFANRLCAEIRRSFAGTATDLTLSAGIAVFPNGGRTAESLLDAADQAMYRAKALGKDRVAVYTDDARSAGVDRVLAHLR